MRFGIALAVSEPVDGESLAFCSTLAVVVAAVLPSVSSGLVGSLRKQNLSSKTQRTVAESNYSADLDIHEDYTADESLQLSSEILGRSLAVELAAVSLTFVEPVLALHWLDIVVAVRAEDTAQVEYATPTQAVDSAPDAPDRIHVHAILSRSDDGNIGS